MPLSPGSSREVVSRNIREMIASGHPQRQAVAAALSNARRHPGHQSGGLVPRYALGGPSGGFGLDQTPRRRPIPPDVREMFRLPELGEGTRYAPGEGPPVDPSILQQWQDIQQQMREREDLQIPRYQSGGSSKPAEPETDAAAPHPDDHATLIDVAPQPEEPAYIGTLNRLFDQEKLVDTAGAIGSKVPEISTLQRLHDTRMRAQGIGRQMGGPTPSTSMWGQPSAAPSMSHAGSLPSPPTSLPSMPSMPQFQTVGDMLAWNQNRINQLGISGVPDFSGRLSPEQLKQPLNMPFNDSSAMPFSPPGNYLSSAAPALQQPLASPWATSNPMRNQSNQWPATGMYTGGGLVQRHFQHGGLTGASMSALNRQAHYAGTNVSRELGSLGVSKGIKLVQSATPGRTDRIPMRARPGSFVLPADVVSGLGQGNTLAGAKMWGQAISHAAGPYGTSAGAVPHARMPSLPRPAMPRSPRGPRTFQGGGLAGGGSKKPRDWDVRTPPPLPIIPMYSTPAFSLEQTYGMPPVVLPKQWGEKFQGGGDVDDDDHTTILVAGGEVIVDPDYVAGVGDGDLEEGSKRLHESVLSVRKQVGDNRKLPEPVK